MPPAPSPSSSLRPLLIRRTRRGSAAAAVPWGGGSKGTPGWPDALSRLVRLADVYATACAAAVVVAALVEVVTAAEPFSLSPAERGPWGPAVGAMGSEERWRGLAAVVLSGLAPATSDLALCSSCRPSRKSCSALALLCCRGASWPGPPAPPLVCCSAMACSTASVVRGLRSEPSTVSNSQVVELETLVCCESPPRLDGRPAGMDSAGEAARWPPPVACCCFGGLACSIAWLRSCTAVLLLLKSSAPSTGACCRTAAPLAPAPSWSADEPLTAAAGMAMEVATLRRAHLLARCSGFATARPPPCRSRCWPPSSAASCAQERPARSDEAVHAPRCALLFAARVSEGLQSKSTPESASAQAEDVQLITPCRGCRPRAAPRTPCRRASACCPRRT